MLPGLLHHLTISFAPNTRPRSRGLCCHCPRFHVTLFSHHSGSPVEADGTQGSARVTDWGEEGSRQGTCVLAGLPPSLEPWETHGGAAGPFPGQPGGWEPVTQPPAQEGDAASQTGSGPSAFIALKALGYRPYLVKKP